MAEVIQGEGGSQRRQKEDDDYPTFNFHDEMVVGYTWIIHHVRMLMCDTYHPNFFSPCHVNIPFFLEIYPRGRGGISSDIFLYLHWRLEEDAVVNIRLTFYGSDQCIMWTSTVTEQKVSKNARLELEKGPDFLEVHQLDSPYIIDDGYLWIKCTVWKYNGPPELPSLDSRYHNIDIYGRSRMDQRLMTNPRQSEED